MHHCRQAATSIDVYPLPAAQPNRREMIIIDLAIGFCFSQAQLVTVSARFASPPFFETHPTPQFYIYGATASIPTKELVTTAWPIAIGLASALNCGTNSTFDSDTRPF